MAKIDTLFLAKKAKNHTAHAYIAHMGYPRVRLIRLLERQLQQKYKNKWKGNKVYKHSTLSEISGQNELIR